ncbi:hypothetical protein H9Q69_009458 [Fusarium xylarioides]|uniref:Uncharacterized protein n=1 Tax=Fusarium xylarioides TaxID=221167 RepID=A0A9P7L8U0_9HYPO|nr:hypothetical protein H9Q70_001858 [Fusarium xylarioides]KAG5769606.1 hypothetical protein H9Q72_003192 [Fusarium xylarioides]KAG5791484.1 hypothetical protein H9Q69_009458 [Fusarium xylarioides]KAG5816972.1 hypothetical protein H9Q71_002151 [Fusarium xylarioides]KAG5828117.1 hypothetical protein H9Q74_001834 [Fusarium xylarioides]
MDPGVNIAVPDKEWLLDQQARVAQLDKSNRRSTKLLARLSAKLESLSYRLGADGSPTACLCAAHHGLDPKLIRRLMLLIIAECTERIQTLRTWRQRIAYPNAVIAWLDRIDAVTGLWIGRKAFNATFGYERVSPTNLVVKSKCEACIMSVIGGRPQVLSDLRAALTTRRDRHIDQGGRDPRLLRLIESWISHQHVNSRRAIYTGSAEISDELTNLINTINCLREKRPESHISRSSSRSVYGHPYRAYEEDGSRSSARARQSINEQSSRSSYSNHSQEDRSKFLRPESRSSQPSAPFQENEQNWMDEDVDYQALLWMDCQMQQRGLTADERRQLFEDDVHPAFSDYAESVRNMSLDDRLQRDTTPEQHRRASTATVKRQSVLSNQQRDSTYSGKRVSIVPDEQMETSSVYSNPSAVPPPLSFSRGPTPPDTTARNSPTETEWVPASVFSFQESAAGGSTPRPDTVEPTSGGARESTIYAQHQAHIDFCRQHGFKTGIPSIDGEPSAPQPARGGKQRDSVAPSIAGSSIYSSHPGFRRSQENVGSLALGGQTSRRTSRMSTQSQPKKSLFDQMQENRRLMEDSDEE